MLRLAIPAHYDVRCQIKSTFRTYYYLRFIGRRAFIGRAIIYVCYIKHSFFLYLSFSVSTHIHYIRCLILPNL
jgi:hypothetical protein